MHNIHSRVYSDNIHVFRGNMFWTFIFVIFLVDPCLWLCKYFSGCGHLRMYRYVYIYIIIYTHNIYIYNYNNNNNNNNNNSYIQFYRRQDFPSLFGWQKLQPFAQEWTWYPRAADQGPQDVFLGHGTMGWSWDGWFIPLSNWWSSLEKWEIAPIQRFTDGFLSGIDWIDMNQFLSGMAF